MAETLNEKYKALVTDNTGSINQMYDASKASNLASLESAYNTNLSDATAQKEQIDKQYNTAANDLAVQYERNRMNNNLQAAGNGLNVGTGSQMALAQAGQYQRDFGNLRGQQAAAQTEQDRQINNLKMQYQSQVQQAIADNDLARATALTQEANRQLDQLTKAYQMQYNEEQDALDRQRQAEMDAYNREQDALDRQWREQQTQYEQQANAASLLASMGDFSGYASLFGLGNDQTSQLQAKWIAENPESAYANGMISAGQYRSMMESSLLSALRSGKISSKDYAAAIAALPAVSTGSASGSGSTGTSWYDLARNSYYDTYGANGSDKYSLDDYLKVVHEHPEMLNTGKTTTGKTTTTNTSTTSSKKPNLPGLNSIFG